MALLHPHGQGLARKAIAGGHSMSPKVPRVGPKSTEIHGLAREILARPGIEGDPAAFLEVSEAYWKALRNSKHHPEKKGPQVVSVSSGKRLDTVPDYDVVVCGGTLGVFVAAALQMRGFRVAIVEKRLLQGRKQEWNISRPEMQGLLDIGLLTQAELDSTIASEFNPIRVGFKGGKDVWVRDVLNCGVSPIALLGLVRAKFEQHGGVVLENTSFRSAEVFDDGLVVTLGTGGRNSPLAVGDTNRPNALGPDPPGKRADLRASAAPGQTKLVTRVMLDCMGHYSDIVKQIRGRAKPDGICLVVGTCAEGFPAATNTNADLLYSFTDAVDGLQLFWEAFPAAGGAARTTYMFAYSDAQPERPTFEALLDRYFELLPQYQGKQLSELHFTRVLFGGFPCYSDGPLAPAWDRIMQVGDASATQSPLSFGGFGSMMRHLGRLTRGLGDALNRDRLERADLAWLHPYQPSLSASWLFQRAMSFGVGSIRRPVAQLPAARDFGPILDQDSMDELDDWVNAAYNGVGNGAEMAVPPPVTLMAPEPSSPNSPLPAWLLLPPEHVNQVLACNFAVMAVLGDRILRPFLQDTIQLGPLSLSMVGMMIKDPIVISRVLLQVGGPTLAKWFFHFTALIAYTFGHATLSPLLSPLAPHNFTIARLLDALEYGSGSDHSYHPPGEGGDGGSLKEASPKPAAQVVEVGEKALVAVVETTAAVTETVVAAAGVTGTAAAAAVTAAAAAAASSRSLPVRWGGVTAVKTMV